jgi:hypothetical protein
MLNLPGFYLSSYCSRSTLANRRRGAIAELDMLWPRLWQARSETYSRPVQASPNFRTHRSGRVISCHALEKQA